MRKNIISFLSSCSDDIKNLCTYLHDNPEVRYNEFNASKYICTLLNKYNFEVNPNFLDIENAFIATKGTGHPKICYLCEYDAITIENNLSYIDFNKCQMCTTCVDECPTGAIVKINFPITKEVEVEG